MQGEGLPKFENAPPAPPKKRKRATKGSPTKEALDDIFNWPLSDKLTLYSELKERIETEKKAMQVQIELINASVK